MTRLGRFAEAMLEACWLSVVILVPLFMDKNVAQVFDPPKAGIVRSIAVLMLFAWATKLLTSPHAETLEVASFLWRALRTPLVVPIALVLLTTLLATAFSVAFNESFWGHVGRARGACTLLAELAIFAAIASNLRSRPQIRRLVTALIYPSVPITLYAIFQRFHLEPLNVTGRETELQRATSLLGQPVFLAAYLGMIMPFSLVRIFEAVQDQALSRVRRGVTLAAYITVLLLQSAAALFSESRAALLGICVSGAMGFLIVAARRGWRRRVISIVTIVAVSVILVKVGSATRWRVVPASAEQVRIARRAAEMLAVTGGQQRTVTSWNFRSTTWHVAERVARNGTALEFVDGSHDVWPRLRPLLGYGPETQYAISTPFYDSKLPDMFGYFLVDRYHNELWDVLVTTGALGFASWLALQSALFWLLFRCLGLLTSPARTRWFWSAYGIGALTGALTCTVVRDLAWVQLGLQCGAVFGLVLFLGVTAILPRHAQPVTQDTQTAPAEANLVIAALAMFVSHLIETSFSFTVSATGLVFWIVLALVLVCAHFRRDNDEHAPPPESSPVKVSRRRAGSARPAASAAVPVWSETLTDAAIVSLGLVPLGLAFLGRYTTAKDTRTVLWEGLTLLSQPANVVFPVVGIIAAATAMLGALLFALDRKDLPSGFAASWRVSSIIALATILGFGAWLWVAWILAHYGTPVANDALVVPWNMKLRTNATLSIYICTLSILLLYALTITWAARTSSRGGRDGRSCWWRTLVLGACGWLGFWAIDRCALRPAAADAAAALGDALKNQNLIALAEVAYQHAAELRPDSDVYQSQLAKAYFAHSTSDPEHALALIERADAAMQLAIARNHTTGEHSTNIAAIRTNRVQRAAEPLRAQLRATVPVLYARALRVNPQDPWLWRLWASAQLLVMDDAKGALASARHAVVLQPKNTAALSLLAECQQAVESGPEAEARR